MRKYCYLYLPLTVALGSVVLGQVQDPPVLDEVVHKEGKNTLVIQRIEQPEFEKDDSIQENSDESQSNGGLSEVAIQSQIFIISATNFASKGTFLKIWPSHLGQQGAFEGWSNIDWSVFQNLLSFNSDNVHYQFMLFHTKLSEDENSPAVPAELPEFNLTGARYLMTSSKEIAIDETLDFLEAIHALYDDNKAQLHEDRVVAIKRQKERKRQIEIEAQKPKTRVMKIWRHTRPETQVVE